MELMPWDIVQFNKGEFIDVSRIKPNDIVFIKRNDGLWYVGQIYPDCFWLLLERAVTYKEAFSFVVAYRTADLNPQDFEEFTLEP
ncbi:hypothetical protein [Buttiauxella noackiae]|uniref:hypothetical protein n=1 Tax=Buttiauxella noackiae TaxID=82992 RepID=UPI002354E2AD|nr:hypothetical protein [Buttiauxella noackiae]MCA1923239.1 hypothetical protein [Buttiauxella noackiae]